MTHTLESDISTLLRYAMMATGEAYPERRAELDACGDRLRAALADVEPLAKLLVKLSDVTEPPSALAIVARYADRLRSDIATLTAERDEAREWARRMLKNNALTPPEQPKDHMTEHKTPTNSDHCNHCNHGKGWTVDCEECGRRAGGDVLSNIAVRVRIEMLEHAVFGRGAAAQLEPIDGCTEDAASCDCSWHENLKRAEERHREPGEPSDTEISATQTVKRPIVEGKSSPSDDGAGCEGLIAYVRHPDGSKTPITPKQWARAVLDSVDGAAVQKSGAPAATICDRHTFCHHRPPCAHPRRRCNKSNCRAGCRIEDERDTALARVKEIESEVRLAKETIAMLEAEHADLKAKLDHELHCIACGNDARRLEFPEATGNLCDSCWNSPSNAVMTMISNRKARALEKAGSPSEAPSDG